jgi:acyl-CoA synthetase (NDP forming)
MARPLQQAITNAYARFPDQLVSVSVTTSEEMAREFDAKGLLTFEDPSRVIKALAALARFEETFASPAPERHSVAPAAPLALPADGKLNEADAKALLARAGVRSPRETLVASPEAAADAAAAIGFPVALKVVSPDILHKTEYGGVALGLATADAVAEAVRRMQATIPARLPDARIDGYLVSEMVSGGVECIVGVARDPAFGPVVTVGLGGVLVELIKDTVCGVAPISEAQAATMIARLKTYPLLAGYRGGPRHDVAALAQAISALSRLAVQHADQIETLEVNPLIVRIEGRGVIALDAVVEIAKG